MKNYSREELFELAAAYALGATSPEESAAIEAALATSPDLAAEVASFRDVAVSIAEQSAVTPSSAVREQFLKRIGDSKSAAIPVQKVVERRIPAGLVMLLAASIVLAAGLAYRNGQLMKELRTQRVSLDSATAQEQKIHDDLNHIFTAERDLRIVHLKSADTAAGPGMQVFWNLKERVGIAHAFRLKPAPTGRSYQIWLLVKGKPVSVKVFNSDPDGHARIENLDLPASAEGVTDVLVTEEPAGGSPGPTTTPFLGGKFPATP